LPATVHLEARIPSEHPSARLLGVERMGSGTIIDPDGLILTANYVVIGARNAAVTTLDGRQLTAEVVRHDFQSGLALVRVAERDLPTVALAPSTDLALGDEVFIVASVGDHEARVANGGVTYLGKFDANWEYVLDRCIMTTAMNPGLGGGPLVDRNGRAVGVVSLNMNEIDRFSMAVPSEYFLDAREAFLASGPRGMGGHAWLGIFCYAIDDSVVIAGVMPGAPGERAGLRPGDVVMAIDGEQVADRAGLYRAVSRRTPGTPVVLTVMRGDRQVAVEVSSGDVVEFFA
jgi:S1-C subfamily serine protease